MELKPRSYEKVQELINKGVDIPNPLTLDIGEEVKLDNISGNGVKIYPGCRIYGQDTVIAAGVVLGAEAPVTLDNCQLGAQAALKGGYFKESVFLEKVNLGLGAQVREACLLEEESGGAHNVGLKQTILFPFVTLGSLINFCDCLMAGGKSRKEHSEVGSSYIHFNFTPEGDKATPSLIGDVPRGVMLNQPPIFLGGQGGMVGPLRLGFGNVTAAGSVVRKDQLEDNRIIISETYSAAVVPFKPHSYKNLTRILRNNLFYLANLVALECWYSEVRRPFFEAMEFGDLLYRGALNKLALAKKERKHRLFALVEKVPASHQHCKCSASGGKSGCELHSEINNVVEIFDHEITEPQAKEKRELFLNAFEKHRSGKSGDYIQAIKNLPPDVSRQGVIWLQNIVEVLTRQAGALLPSFRLIKS